MDKVTEMEAYAMSTLKIEACVMFQIEGWNSGH